MPTTYPTYQQATVNSNTSLLKGELLWTGRVTFTHNENAMHTLDVPAIGVGTETACLLNVRNSSSVVDVVVNVGSLVIAQPAANAGATPLSDTALAALRWTFGSTGSNTVFQSTAHGLSVGDALECVTAGGTNCTPGVVYYVHGADHETDVPADTLYLSLTRADGGSLIDASTNVVGVFKLASELHIISTFTVEKFVAANVATPSVITGMESTLITGWPFYSGQGKISFGFADADAGIFTVYAEIRRA